MYSCILCVKYRILIEETSENDFMKKFIELWNKHDTALKMVRDINMYLDRNIKNTIVLLMS